MIKSLKDLENVKLSELIEMAQKNPRIYEYIDRWSLMQQKERIKGLDKSLEKTCKKVFKK